MLVCVLGAVRLLGAHEVPARVAVNAIAKAERDALRLVVRVPLESVRDLDIPLVRSDYLDVGKVTPLLPEAATLWILGYLEVHEGDRRLDEGQVVAARIALPSDRSFESFDAAVAGLHGPPLPNDAELPWRQAMLDVELRYPIQSATSRFSVRPLLAHLGVTTTTVLRWVGPDGSERAFQYEGNPGLVRLDPAAWEAAGSFVKLGFQHILEGVDHLLFLLCLVIPFRRVRPLVAIVTAFTAAHSITLIAAALGMAPRVAWFPPLIEFLIAASIVVMALENIVGPKLERRWMVAFGFGLIHGFGFSFALGETLQFAGRHLITSLLAFNLGVELGQLVLVAAAVPVLSWCLTRVVPERVGIILVSALVAHSAWHWMAERFTTVREYSFELPALDLALAVTLLRFLMLLLIIVAVLWLVSSLVGRLAKTPPPPARAALFLLSCLVPAALLVPGNAAAQGGAAAAEVRSTLKGVFTDAQASRGKDIYVMSCRECHVPASHTGVVFKNSWGGKLLSDLLAYMMERMPKNSPGSLTNDEYAAVTAYILMLNGLPSGDDELPTDPAQARRIRIDTAAR